MSVPALQSELLGLTRRLEMFPSGPLTEAGTRALGALGRVLASSDASAAADALRRLRLAGIGVEECAAGVRDTAHALTAYREMV
ncbi:hypothetical protein FHR81_000823 [Actinoalloteichus hoggarensis]|uniref:Uncharacterized protein n=1 Tax=Actinoalloteichus hoggarensis TaxID=1470176 RepID=A0A221W193_9PSEU|nr:hypothetical protein [Actinoalloteichus hoggarensis]ASO19500.1 hypothetical protein AHOG_09280 [Actinoalloteichus hoggarensis]MBB5919794.1 hypothetical protein [Actinoalloteichus hoggarensis]